MSARTIGSCVVVVGALLLTTACSRGTVEEAGCASLPTADTSEASQEGPAVVVVAHPSIPPGDLEAGLRSVSDAVVPDEPDVSAAPRLSVIVGSEAANEVVGTCVDGAALAPHGAGHEVRRHSLTALRSGLAGVALREVRRASPGDDGTVHREDPIAALVGGAEELQRLSVGGGGTLVVIAPGIPTAGRCAISRDADPNDASPIDVEIDASGGTFDNCASMIPDLKGVRVLWVGVGRGHQVSTSASQVLESDLRELLEVAGADHVTVSADPRVPTHAFDVSDEDGRP